MEVIMEIQNAYEDYNFAGAYSQLEFPGTYYLAYRDLPEIFTRHVRGRRALDFGCGTGRSSRFLKQQGFETVGVDIADNMLARARYADPTGDYRLIGDGDFGDIETGSFDLVLSAFTFDNIPGMERKVKIFKGLGRLLKSGGHIVNLVSAPEIYTHEWASFSTKDFPENRSAMSGDIVKIINTAIKDDRPVDDVIWPDESYRETYDRAGLVVVRMYKPLAKESEPYEWVNETRIAPWVIYVLRTSGQD